MFKSKKSCRTMLGQKHKSRCERIWGQPCAGSHVPASEGYDALSQDRRSNCVLDFLGHGCSSNDEVCINVDRTLLTEQSQDFAVKVAERPEEIKALLEVGFEYVCWKDGWCTCEDESGKCDQQ